ncbi:MAG TPA: ABC transporter permease [Atribacteraceae bacterium]|nr:ABC transporter permease [Atribacteraceae bacterium]
MNQIKKVLLLREISSFIMLFVVILVFFLISPLFLSRHNIGVVLEIIPELGIVAVGVTMLMISGEFDLSVGSVFAFTPIMLIMLVDAGMYTILALATALLMAIGIGALHGFITLTFGIPSFITTLGGMMIWRGAILLITGGWPPFFPPEINTHFLVGRIGILRASIIWYVVITVVIWIILERTDFGNWVFATGGNQFAARAMGIETNRVKLLNFMLCSFLAGFTGIVQSFRLGTSIPTMGTGLELEAIAATVIGGTALAGGVGTVIGTLVGSFLIRVIDNGLVMARAPGYWFRVFIGIATISAVILNIYVRERAKKLRC